jgi:hypothetical protein
MMKVELVGGPRDGDIFAVQVLSESIRMAIPPSPSFTINKEEEVIPLAYVYYDLETPFRTTKRGMPAFRFRG